MTNKQQAWLARYLTNGFNATEAARHAKYTDPEKSGWENSNKLQPEVQAALTAHAMSAAEALARLSNIARVDMDDLLDTDGYLDIEKARELGVTHLIKELKADQIFDKDGDHVRTRTQVKLHDAQSAIVDILKAHGVFKERVENTGDVTIRIVRE